MRAALLSLCLVAAAGCKVKNPNYCEGEPNDLCTQVDAPGMQCDDNTDCTDPMAEVCKMPGNYCVQCVDNSTCSDDAPICDTTSNQCGPCTKHADCPASNACLPTGRCAIATEVAYVRQGGTNNPTCEKTTPCADVTAALAATPAKSVIRIEGTITGAPITISNRDVTLLGDPKTSILNRTSGEVMIIDGSSNVRLYDLTIADAAGNIGISALSGHTGVLELQRCTVTNNGTGIVVAGTGALILSRSTVSLNLNAGGIVLSNNTPKFDITNNFIFRNGNENTAPVGGIAITGATTMGSRLEFNTIVDNDAQSGGARSGGVQCQLNGFSAPNNLIARNAVDGNPSAATAQINGCMFTGSLIQADFTNLLFTSANTIPFDYHLKTGSAGIDGAMSGAQLMTDFDGQARPNGMFRDLGADELYP